jgi:hypothetical protein
MGWRAVDISGARCTPPRDSHRRPRGEASDIGHLADSTGLASRSVICGHYVRYAPMM